MVTILKSLSSPLVSSPRKEFLTREVPVLARLAFTMIPLFAACLWIFVREATGIYPLWMESFRILQSPMDSSWLGSPITMSFEPLLIDSMRERNKSPPTIDTSSKMTADCGSGLFAV